MELAELAAYAEEKYRMAGRAQMGGIPRLFCPDRPGYREMGRPFDAAVDFDAGMEIQRCDIKCGREALQGGYPACPPPSG